MTQRNAWALALMGSLMVLGCGTPSKVDGGVDAGTTGCLDDTDCPDPQLFFCDTTSGTCEPACRTKKDCTDRGQYAIESCTTGLGCECDEGKCEASLCSADSDCGSTQVCRSGACVAAPAASSVASCQLAPDFVVMKPGTTAKFFVSAWDSAKAPVVVKDGEVTWSAPAGSPLTAPATTTGLTATFTAGSTATAGTAGVVAVRATIGSAHCDGKAIVLPAAPAANEAIVVVIDELTNRPVPNADVVLSNTAGVIVQQGSPAADAVRTDARGVATLTVGSLTTFTVTAFHPDYGYVTIANYSGTSRYLSIVTRRNQVDKYGGYAGNFNNVPATGNVHIALAAMSLAGAVTNLALDQLLGPTVPTDINISTQISAKGVKIPAGVYLGYNDKTFKGSVAGQGLAGVCYTSSGEADEEKIATGSCGTRTAWALAGDVPLGKLPIDAVTGGGEIKIGELLSRILPIFKLFNSAVARDVAFSLKPTPIDAGTYVFSDQSHFTTTNLDFEQTKLSFSFAAKLPELPKFRGSYVDGAAIIGGSYLAGRGVIPLGIGVGVNTDNNAQIDKQGEYPSAGLVQVRMAPNHHGLEGATYGMLIAAISAKAASDLSAGVGASAIYARIPGNKLTFDPAGTSPVDVSSLSFPVFADGAKFNYSDSDAPGLKARSFRIVNATPIDLSGVNIVRVAFSDDLGHRWEVLADPAGLSDGFTLPKPPGVYADRLFTNGVSSGERSGLVVQALRLNTKPGEAGGTAVTFNNFVEVGSTNAERTTELLTGFSFLDFGKPSISFSSPKDNNASINKGDKVTVKVEKFKVGTTADADGVVKISFSKDGTPVAECPAQTFNATSTSGEVDYTVPTTCSGTGVVIKAELLRIDGTTPVAPAVSATRTVTIK